MLLKDKVVVISGVGPGLGQTMAKMACTEGAAVILGARNQKFLAEVAGEIEASGGRVFAQSTDVADTEQVNALIAAGAEKFGRIDGLVNSAYIHGNAAQRQGGGGGQRDLPGRFAHGAGMFSPHEGSGWWQHCQRVNPVHGKAFCG